MTTKILLLYIDKPGLGEMIKSELEAKFGYEIVLVYVEQEGVAKALTKDFNLVITDLSQEGIDGAKVLDDIKKAKPDLPVIVFSVYFDDDSVVSAAVRQKADAVISKMLNIDQVHKIIQEVLEKRGIGNG